jgi:signal transduction histidine kinase
MLNRLLGPWRLFWALLIVALALASLTEIAAPAEVWTGSLMAHAGWVLGLLAALLALLASVTTGLRVKSNTSPKIDQWFLLTVLCWLLLMLSLGWEELAPTGLVAACLLHASYQLTAFAVSQFLLWSSPFETGRLRAFAWAHLVLALVLLVVTCVTGRWIESAFQAWRILNVVGNTALLLLLGRALLSNGEGRSWLILGGGLMALGLMLSNMSAGSRGASEASPVHYMFAAYLLMLWLLVSRRIPSPAGPAAEHDDPFESSFFAGEALPLAMKTGAGEAVTQGPNSDTKALLIRRSIAQDLHDGVGSQLVSIISSLDPSDSKQRVVASALEQCLLDVKILVDDMEEVHENVLDALGRLRYRVQHSLDRQGIELTWEVEFDGPLLQLSDDRSRQVLHVAQEALVNVMRHARATRVTVRCHAPPPGKILLLEVHDDGAGFQVPQPGQSGGKGLKSMRRRAVAVDGQLVILSEPGCGTLVRMTMPL